MCEKERIHKRVARCTRDLLLDYLFIPEKCLPRMTNIYFIDGPGGLTLQREIGLLACRQSSLHKLLLPVMKKKQGIYVTWRQESGGRMLTQGWR